MHNKVYTKCCNGGSFVTKIKTNGLVSAIHDTAWDKSTLIDAINTHAASMEIFQIASGTKNQFKNIDLTNYFEKSLIKSSTIHNLKRLFYNPAS